MTNSNSIRISYQGVKGSYSYQACIDTFPDGDFRGYRSFFDAMQAVHSGDVDYAIIPVENSTAGRVMEVYNILPESKLHIIGEYLLPIDHCLMIPRKSFRGSLPSSSMSADEALAWKDSPLSDEEKSEAFKSIQEVRSHPQALAQCRKYLERVLPKATQKRVYDTASSAREISADETADVAAIASRSAAEIYNMIILEDGAQDIDNNTTRFLVLAKEPLADEKLNGPCLTTILFETGHEAGSLLKALQVFEKHNISMTKLETYMSGAIHPNPTFYVDVGEGLHKDNMKVALDQFKQHTNSLTIMGSYPADKTRGGKSSFLSVE